MIVVQVISATIHEGFWRGYILDRDVENVRAGYLEAELV